MGVLRAVSMEAIATGKTADEDEEQADSSEGLPDNLYRRISMLGDPKYSAVAVLEGWIKEGKKRPKNRDLRRMAMELRKHSRHKHALEIFEWMSQNFSFSPGEYAIHLDLIAKVRGIVSAEKYFADLPDIEKNKQTYSMLLSCYVKDKNVAKSEATMEKLKYLGFAKDAVPYTEMMSLYMNTQQFEKVPSLIWEMKKNGISLDTYCYNFWMKSYAAMSDMDRVEDVLNEIERDDNIDADYTVHSTLVNIYIKAKVLDKAQSALKEMENKMKGMEAKKKRKERVAYDYLISLHGILGNKDEIYRIWQSFESTFPEMTYRSHICLLSSLARIGDIEGAEDFIQKWESVKSFHDIRAFNVLLDAYIKKGWLQKAEVLLERIKENGGKPNSTSWKILAEGYIHDGQFNKAIEAMKKYLSVGRNRSWQPLYANVLAILKHFEDEGDVKSAEDFFRILRGVKFVSTEVYNSLLRSYVHVGKVPPRISEMMKEDNVSPDEETAILLKKSDVC